jgi:hypothetical protein
MKKVTVLFLLSLSFAYGYTPIVNDNFTNYSDTADFFSKAVGGAGKLYRPGRDQTPTYMYIDNTTLYNNHHTLRYHMPGNESAVAQNAVYFAPRSNMWVRTVVRYGPNWTTVGTGLGSNGQPSASSYKFFGGGWHNYYSRISMEYSNGASIGIEIGATNKTSGAWVMPWNWTTLQGFDAAAAWNNGVWYQYIFYLENTSATSMQYRVWIAPVDQTPQLKATVTSHVPPGTPVPLITSINLGMNYNQLRLPGQDIFLNYGEWEVVNPDVYADPYGLLTPPYTPEPGDVDGNRVVDMQDLILVSNNFRTNADARADTNNDTQVDLFDLVIVAKNWGATY